MYIRSTLNATFLPLKLHEFSTSTGTRSSSTSALSRTCLIFIIRLPQSRTKALKFTTIFAHILLLPIPDNGVTKAKVSNAAFQYSLLPKWTRAQPVFTLLAVNSLIVVSIVRLTMQFMSHGRLFITFLVIFLANITLRGACPFVRFLL